MSAFKDSGHFWWQQCQSCQMAWFVGDNLEDIDVDETCDRCQRDDRIAAEARAQALEEAEQRIKAIRDEERTRGDTRRAMVLLDALDVIRDLKTKEGR